MTVSDTMEDSSSAFIAAGGGGAFRDFARLRTDVADPSFATIFDIDDVATDDFVRFVIPALDVFTLSDDPIIPRERVMIAMTPAEAVVLFIQRKAAV